MVVVSRLAPPKSVTISAITNVEANHEPPHDRAHVLANPRKDFVSAQLRH
jgi:hypothetical protein